jgi:hypothetical protein
MPSIRRLSPLIITSDVQGLEDLGWPQYDRTEETVKDEKVRPFAYMIGGSYTTTDGKAESGIAGLGGSDRFFPTK